MSVAIIYSRAQSGIDAPLVTVEVHLSSGLPSYMNYKVTVSMCRCMIHLLSMRKPAMNMALNWLANRNLSRLMP